MRQLENPMIFSKHLLFFFTQSGIQLKITKKQIKKHADKYWTSTTVVVERDAHAPEFISESFTRIKTLKGKHFLIMPSFTHVYTQMSQC